MPIDQQGIKVLGTPVGHDDYVRRLLEKVQAKQQVLLDVIPKCPTSSQRGFFSSTALQRAPIVNSELSDPGWSSRLQSLTIKVYGGVSVPFWRFLWTRVM